MVDRNFLAFSPRVPRGGDMPHPWRSNATYSDFEDAPDDRTAELIDGDLYLQPRPAVPHQAAASVLTMLLGPPYQLGRGGPGGWWILPEVELHFRGHILVPDLAGWYRKDLTADDTRATFITETPRWVCEVLSPRTQGLDRGRKMDLYRNWGVRYVWLVDPKKASIEVFDFIDGRTDPIQTASRRDEEIASSIAAPPFEQVEIRLSELFPVHLATDVEGTADPSPQ